MTKVRFLFAPLTLSLALTAPPAHAQAEDQAAARALFGEGRKLLKAGHYAEACQKLEAASKLYTSAGILLNLGDCYAKSGRTASAWTEFGEAAAVAKRTGRDAEGSEASHRQADIEPKLTRLLIHIAKPSPSMSVTQDGNDVPQAAWGTGIPVDPGAHAIHAEAPGFEAWTGSVDANGAGETATVEVPELTKSPAAAQATPTPVAGSGAPPPPLESAPPPEHHSHVLEWTLIGAGAAVGIAGGVVLGVESSRAHTATDNNDKATYDSTKTPWAIGLGAVIVGGVSAVTGVVLLATGHSGAPASTGAVGVLPWGGPGGGGVDVAGAF